MKLNKKNVFSLIFTCAILQSSIVSADEILTVNYYHISGTNYNSGYFDGSLQIDLYTNTIISDTVIAMNSNAQQETIFNVGDNATEYYGIGSNESYIKDNTNNSFIKVSFSEIIQNNLSMLGSTINSGTVYSGTNGDYPVDFYVDSTGGFAETLTGSNPAPVPLPTSIFIFISGLLAMLSLGKKPNKRSL